MPLGRPRGRGNWTAAVVREPTGQANETRASWKRMGRLAMSDLFFLERMMTERVRQIERDAQLRSRLGVSHQQADPVSVRLRRTLGTWLIRIGQRLRKRETASCETTARSVSEPRLRPSVAVERAGPADVPATARIIRHTGTPSREHGAVRR